MHELFIAFNANRLSNRYLAIDLNFKYNFLDIGTGNGMIKSLLDSVGDACSAPNAIFSVIRGHPSSLSSFSIFHALIRVFHWNFVSLGFSPYFSILR